MVRSTVGLILFSLLLTLRCTAQANPPGDIETKLGLRIDHYELRARNFPEALMRLAGEFQLPMGIAWLNAPSARENLTLHWDDLTVRDIVEETAQAQLNYDVSVTNGVVHISSRDIPSNQNFLSIRVPRFTAVGVANSVKVSLWMQLNQIISPDPQRGYAGDIFTSKDDPHIDADFTDATVAEILDKLALISDRKVWIVTFQDDLNLTQTGFRRTMSLLSGNTTPDYGEPEWDIFGWNWKVSIYLEPRQTK